MTGRILGSRQHALQIYPTRNAFMPILKVGAVFVFGALSLAMVILFAAACT